MGSMPQNVVCQMPSLPPSPLWGGRNRVSDFGWGPPPDVLATLRASTSPQGGGGRFCSAKHSSEELNDGFCRLSCRVFIVTERHFAAFAFEGERIERRDVGFLAVPGMR